MHPLDACSPELEVLRLPEVVVTRHVQVTGAWAWVEDWATDSGEEHRAPRRSGLQPDAPGATVLMTAHTQGAMFVKHKVGGKKDYLCHPARRHPVPAVQEQPAALDFPKHLWFIQFDQSAIVGVQYQFVVILQWL